MLSSSFNTGAGIGYLKVYIIGAALGALASTIAAARIKRARPNTRSTNLILIIGVFVAGSVAVSLTVVQRLLFGKAAPQTGLLLMNHALGYFLVGVTFDAVRLAKAKKRKALM